MANINTNKNYEDMSLKEKFNAYIVYEKFKNSFSSQDEFEFSLSADELKAKIEKLNKMELRRRRLNANRKKILADRKQLQTDKSSLQLQLKEEIELSKKEALKKEIKALNEKIKASKEHTSKITKVLKEELPSLSEIQKTRNRFRKIRGYRLSSSKLKAKEPEKVRQIFEASQEIQNDSSAQAFLEETQVDISTPTISEEVQNNASTPIFLKEKSNDSPVATTEIIKKNDINITIPEYSCEPDFIEPYLSERNNTIISKIVKEYNNIGKVRQAKGLNFSYISPIVDDDRVLDCEFVTESLKDDTKNCFANNPLKTYKKALKEKIRFIKKTKILEISGIKNLDAFKKRMLDNFEYELNRRDLNNENYDRCVELYIALKTAITSTELMYLINYDQYPLDDYSVCKVSSIPKRRPSLFDRFQHKLDFETYEMKIGALHPEREKTIVNNFSSKSSNSALSNNTHTHIHTRSTFENEFEF